MHFQTTFALALVALFTAATASANITNEDLSRDPWEQTKQIKQIFPQIFVGESEEVINTAIRICMCESGGRTKDNKPIGTIVHIEADGSIREGKEVNEDTGACQINPTKHSKDWKLQNGFSQKDADDIFGNIRYTYALIQDKRDRNTKHRLGIWEDWKSSESCWKE